MASIGKYGYVNAKVRAMRSILLSATLYKNLIAAKDLNELIKLLSQTHFKDRFDQINIQDETEIEHMLLWDEIHRLQMIKKSSRGELCEIIDLFIERYDLYKLKAILRCWYSEGNNADKLIREKIIYDFPIDFILDAKRLDEIIDRLALTPFSRILKKASSDFTQKKSLFPLELALEKDYFSRFIEMGNSLGKRDSRIFRRLVGLEIDLKNLDWIGRYKTYYKMSTADIGAQLLPFGYRIDSEKIRHIIKDDNFNLALSQAIENFQTTSLGDREGGVTLETLDKFLYHILFSEARRVFGEFPFSIGSILGYYYLMRIESKNLRTLFQAKTYGLSVDEIDQLLVY